MSATIWKHDVPVIDGEQKITLPTDARIVHVATQRPGVVSFWEQHSQPESVNERRFVVVGTGHPIDEDFVYVGTAHDAPFVWHLYEWMPF